MLSPDAVARVNGTLELVQSMSVPNMVHARVIRSPYPHATVTFVDADEARSMPGVIGVWSGADLEAHPALDPYFGALRRDQPILAIRPRYAGDPVVMVVAETEAQAAAAAMAVDVDYDELPYVVDAVRAAQPGAAVVHDDWPDNDCGTTRLRHGDIEEGWRQSDRVYTDVYTSPPASHVPMEPHVAIAEFTNDDLIVWTSAQSPFLVRNALAEIFKMPKERVSVRVQNVGGGYGGKNQVKIEPIAAAAAFLTGRPVRLELTRVEVFQTVGKHAAHVEITTGVKHDGTIVARHVKIHWNAGAYAVTSPGASGQGLVRAPGPYRIPYVAVDSTARYTNTVPTGPFRGAMTSQLCWAYESQLDDIARDLGIDPVELRRRNVLVDGDEFATGEVMHDMHVQDLLDATAAAIGWDEPLPAPTPTRVRGRGLAVMLKSTMTPTRSEARLIARADGTFVAHAGSVEMGQGARPTMMQLAAEAIGVPVDAIELPYPDTQVAPFDTMTASSRSTFSMGRALGAAADDLRLQLSEVAAAQLGVGAETLSHANGAIHRDGEFACSYADVLRGANLDQIAGEGVYQSVGGPGSLDENGQGLATAHWHQGAAAAEVEVDLETGHVTVVAAHGACYAGHVVDAVRVRQQNEGCVVFGLGPTLFEELVYDDGQIVNPNLSDYMIPSIVDVPTKLTSTAVESGDAASELHGVGEMAVPPVAPAVANAVFAATGVRIRDLPLSPERVLRALLGEQEPS